MPEYIEGRDYYIEDGLYVWTEDYLRRRGYCCRNGCRHCPYGFNEATNSADADDPPAD